MPYFTKYIEIYLIKTGNKKKFIIQIILETYIFRMLCYYSNLTQ